MWGVKCGLCSSIRILKATSAGAAVSPTATPRPNIRYGCPGHVVVPPSLACLLEALINAAEAELIHLVMRTMRTRFTGAGWTLVAKAGGSKLLESVGPLPPLNQQEPLLERDRCQ